jgi:hypothetical protein
VREREEERGRERGREREITAGRLVNLVFVCNVSELSILICILGLK